MPKLRITEKEYECLIKTAAEIEARSGPSGSSNRVPDNKRFLYRDSLPTVNDLKKCNVGPEPENEVTKDILLYLVYLSEQVQAGTDINGDPVYRYIYTPDARYMSEKEIREFKELRKYVEKTIIKNVEIIYAPEA